MTFTRPRLTLPTVRIVGTVVLAALLHAAVPALAYAQRGVAPPKARFQGLTLAEWGAEYLRALLETPAEALPLPCAFGQRGRALFLATSNGEPLEMDCTVAPGTPLVFPLYTFAGWCTASDPLCEGFTIEDLRAILAADVDLIDPARELLVEVDGVPVTNLGRFRAPGDLKGAVVAGNVFGYEVTEPITFGAQDGYWMVLAPLSAGRHTVRIYASQLEEFGFEVDTIVHLTVER